jgi:hypothetical protein
VRATLAQELHLYKSGYFGFLLQVGAVDAPTFFFFGVTFRVEAVSTQ